MSETIQTQSKLYPFHSDGLAAVLSNHEHLNTDSICDLSEPDLISLSQHLNRALEDCACVLGGIQALIAANRAAPESARLDEARIDGLLAAVNRAVAAPMLPLSVVQSAVWGDLGYRGGYEQAEFAFRDDGEAQS